MKSLLIALLLAIFSFEAAFVVSGEHMAAANRLEILQAAAAASAPDQRDLHAAGLNLTNAVDELSDYLPAELSIARAPFIAPLAPLPAKIFLSIVLPTITPPPRA